MRVNLYFAANEDHKCDKQSLKISKIFDDANRRKEDIVFLIFAILQKSQFPQLPKNKLIISLYNYTSIFYGIKHPFQMIYKLSLSLKTCLVL